MDRIVLIAEGPTGAAALESLVACFDVCAIFRKPTMARDPVATLAAEHAIPLIGETNLASVESALRRLRPACVVISSYNRLVRPEVLELCPFINVHYGPLPRYRGRANVNWAILNHESEAAITIHAIDSDLDSGNILFQRFIPIGSESTVTELYEQLNEIQRQELGRSVAQYLGGYTGVPQRGPATYCCARVPDDGGIDWTAPTRDVYAMIRALEAPYSGAYTFFRLQRIVITRASPPANTPEYVGRVPGRVCSINLDSGAVDVLTGDGVLRIYEVLDGGGVRARAADLIRSTRDTLGLAPRDLLERIQQLERTLASITLDSPSKNGPINNGIELTEHGRRKTWTSGIKEF